jgi:predicted nucleic acid-binding protein
MPLILLESNAMSGNKISIDSCVLIDFLQASSRLLKDVVDSERFELRVSELVYAELLYRYSGEQLAATELDKILSSLNISPREISKDILVKAAELRFEYGIKTPDALHMASAVISGSKVFLTQDKKLLALKKIKSLTITNKI